MRKVAVIFPGVGYTKDRPLLYYAGKQAIKAGYELLHVDFSGISWSKEELKDRDFLLRTLDRCLKMTEEALYKAGDLHQADVVFISKSIGTVVATAYAGKKNIKAKQICFSPLEMIDEFIDEEGGILFYGNNDPYADYRDIERIAKSRKLKTYCVDGGNHSLETGDFCTDADNLKDMIMYVSEILG